MGDVQGSECLARSVAIGFGAPQLTQEVLEPTVVGEDQVDDVAGDRPSKVEGTAGIHVSEPRCLAPRPLAAMISSCGPTSWAIRAGAVRSSACSSSASASVR